MCTVTSCCTTEMIFLPCGKPRGKRNNLKMRKLKGNPSHASPPKHKMPAKRDLYTICRQAGETHNRLLTALDFR